MGDQFEVIEPVAAVLVTGKLHARQEPAPDYLREKLAIQDLATQMADRPSEILPRLVRLAMEICAADSAGISVLEPEQERFRWLGLAGVLAVFEGATTPRHNSPCGVCLDHLAPILMEHPERAYDWIRDARIAVPEVLLVPLQVKGEGPLGTLWIVARTGGHFHAGHARVLAELASFVGVALRMIQSEQRLTAALNQQETLAKEMSHRMKNLFALVDGMVRMSARTAVSADTLASALSGRLRALASAHGLVRRSFSEDAIEATTLEELMRTILRPHSGTHRLAGPAVALGQRAANDLALVLHELATNAAKYGALSRSGIVNVTWTANGERLRIEWREEGGPPVGAAPTVKGFGTTLSEKTLTGHLEGTIDYDWRKEGLRVSMTVPAGRLKL